MYVESNTLTPLPPQISALRVAFCFPLSIIRLMSAPVAPQKIMTHGDLMMKIPSPPPIPSYLHMLRAIKKTIP